jgi:hypothetical protein
MFCSVSRSISQFKTKQTQEMMSNFLDFSKINEINVRYMLPKTDRFVTTRNIISLETNKGLSIKTPLTKTYGIEDGVRNFIHDGKFKVKLLFSDIDNARVEIFKENVKRLDTKIIQDAISAKWLGNDMSNNMIASRYCPIFDCKSKSAFIKANVPNANGSWDTLTIMDTNENVIFPNSQDLLPSDLVHRKSGIICRLNITQVWIKLDKSMWGVSVKLVECVVFNPKSQDIDIKSEPEPFGICAEDLADFDEFNNV